VVPAVVLNRVLEIPVIDPADPLRYHQGHRGTLDFGSEAIVGALGFPNLHWPKDALDIAPDTSPHNQNVVHGWRPVWSIGAFGLLIHNRKHRVVQQNPH
jgi:hypothetical protein